MKLVRNLLVTYGACALASRLVGLFTAGLTFPLSLRATPGLNAGSSMVTSTGAACVAAALAGIASGLAVETLRPARWSLILAALVWFEYGGGYRPFEIVEFPSLRYTLLISFLAAVSAVLSFHGVRAVAFGRRRLARAA